MIGAVIRAGVEAPAGGMSAGEVSMTNDAGARVGASRPSRATEADAERAEGVATGDGDPDGRWRPFERICTAADVPAEPVRWLWKDHFALGKISVVAGSADVGKTLMVAGDFASRVSCGTAWPGGSACPAGDVVIVGRHDGLTDTLVPRLKDHGADLRRVHFVGGVVYDNCNRFIPIPVQFPRRGRPRSSALLPLRRRC